MWKQHFKLYRFSALSGFLILLFATFISITADAQRPTSFSDDIEYFPIELYSVIRTQLSKENEPLTVELTQLWTSEFFTPDEKKQIVETSNLILHKTDANVSHFITLIKIILYLQYDQNAKNQFTLWLQGLGNYARNDRISIEWVNKFLVNSNNFFSKNSLKVNPAYEWKTSGGNYTFKVDSIIVLNFENTSLICTNGNDSITIHLTQGSYNPLTENWRGKGGKVTWIRSQFPEDEIFATLTNYKIDLTKNEYKADSVWFTNLDYFKEPSRGRLKDMLIKGTRPENVAYPEFHTYDLRHRINNLFDGVDFDGGYYMLGTKFYGSGTREEPAIIEVKRNGRDFLRIEAKTYVFLRQSVVSDYARARFILGKDSLYHTGLGFSYNENTRTIVLAPTEFITTQSPIQSTYHNFSINFNQISWKLDKDEIEFGPLYGSRLGRATFESNNFFNEESFDLMMGRDSQHPLFAIYLFSENQKSRTINVEDFSLYVRKPIEQTRIVVMQMATLGFILYEYETGEITLLPKLIDAINARKKFIDYDVIKFQSNTQGTPNAILKLATFEMEINGVQNLSVSDSQNVFIYPANQKLTLKKNRNFDFDGVVRAGLFTFQGKGFAFDYSKFSFHLDKIDRLNLDYQTKDYDFYGRRILNSVTSTLESITGEIFIDEPQNKSGLTKNPQYPIFKSTKNSFVYYDDPSIHNGVYNREKFYFEIFPFTFYNINNFEFKDMNFTGMFYSADILSPLKDTLILRPDNSLGFRRESPPSGFAVYQGKGKFYNRIDLSNRGLRGMGEFTYITSSTKSNDLYFFPDSLGTRSTDFSIRRQDSGIQYPEVKGAEHIVKWFPYEDILYAYKGSKPFEMFEKQSTFIGDLTLTPLGLTGKGLMDMGKARLASSLFEYNAIDYFTNRASVEFNVVGSDSLAFISKSLKAQIDFNTRTGQFQQIDGSIFATLNPMMYETHLDGFSWSITQNELTLATPTKLTVIDDGKFYLSGMADKDSIPNGSLFYSTWRGEDSLYFFSKKAKYSLRNPNLKADSVKYFIVADAIIYPYRQKLEVDAMKRIIPLRQSVILANYTDKFHRIYDAEISVPNRKKYFAKGVIDYVDENDSIQKINLREVGVDGEGNTFAKTTLTEPDKFKLSSHFGFFGNVDLMAKEKHWLFAGGAQPIHSCVQAKSSNVKFKSSINPQSIFIPVTTEQPTNLNNVYLINGGVVTVDSIYLYPSFLSVRKTFSDKTIINSSGYLHYNLSRNRFMLGSIEKITNPDTTGNLISLTKDFCLLFSEGTVQFPVNLGQIKNYTTGNLIHKLEDSTLTMDLILSFDFHFNQVSLEAMANEIITHPGLPGVDLNRKVFQKALYERSTPREAEAAINQIKLFGAMSQIPSGFQNTITFADIKMKWDPLNRSFVSYGKIGIGTIGNIQVNKRVDGFVEILKLNTGDRMMMYLELAPNKYYVFYYVRGSMQVSSHNPAFTDPIKEMKSKDRKVKVKLGQIPYNFVVGTKRELETVRARYQKLSGISTPTNDIIEQFDPDGNSENDGEDKNQ
jgi:hypothetical protein